MIRTCVAQRRIAPSGHVLGFDFAAMLAIATALGYCLPTFLNLINDAEAGMLQGMRETEHGDA